MHLAIRSHPIKYAVEALAPIDQKDAMSSHLELNDDSARDGPPAPQQETTKFMIFFSTYIALAGWVYNFDLG